MAIVLGLDGVCYRGTAGTTATTEMKNVRDVTVSVECDSADITTRNGNGWKTYAATLKDATITFTMLYDSEDADFVAIRDAFMNGTALSLFPSDGDGHGLDCDITVTSFEQGQQLAEAMTVDVTCKPTFIGGTAGRAPDWV